LIIENILNFTNGDDGQRNDSYAVIMTEAHLHRLHKTPSLKNIDTVVIFLRDGVLVLIIKR